MSNEFPSRLKPKKRTAAGIPPTAVLRVFEFLTAAATAAAVAAAAAHSTEGAAAEAAARLEEAVDLLQGVVKELKALAEVR